MFQGQIFNPATTRLVNGIPVRDPYPSNLIPAGDPLRSQVAARIAQLMVRPDRPAPRSTSRAIRRAIRRGSSTRATSCSASTTASLRTSASSHSFYWNRRPSIRNCGEVGGCTVAIRWRTRAGAERHDTTARVLSSASPRTTRTSSSTGSIKPTPAESHDGRLRPLVHGRELTWRPASAGRSGSGGANQGGILDTDGGPPVMTFAGNIPYNASARTGRRSASW